MNKQLLSVRVKGNENTWAFHFYGDPMLIDVWRKDGVEVIEISNTVPFWVVKMHIVRPWCFLQDLINFKNPFGQ